MERDAQAELHNVEEARRLRHECRLLRAALRNIAVIVTVSPERARAIAIDAIRLTDNTKEIR